MRTEARELVLCCTAGSTTVWLCSRLDEAVVAKVTVCRNCACLVIDTGKRCALMCTAEIVQC